MSLFTNYKYTSEARFLRYVQIDTQSDPDASCFPSTEKQKNLAKVLVEELQAMGVKDAEMDEHGYVYATIPSNIDKANVPVICFCSHMDTSPDCSGENVKPIVHRNYDGGVLSLPGDPNVSISPKDHPELLNQVGNDIVTADGTTLLGADNKAGVAEIMDAAHFLMTHPEVKHGTMRILFTPDEEVGRGVENVDMKRLGADFGYTMDGETLGHLENETFSADMAILSFEGVSAHPGFAKGHMESSLRIASEVIARMPRTRLTPETTEGKEGFIHPLSVNGTVEKTVVKWILRSFTTSELAEMAKLLEDVVKEVMVDFPRSRYELKIIEQYRNMKEVLDEYPQVTALAVEAIQRAGLDLHLGSIRGGTDGSRLSFMGLPCPNIFAGEHGIHGKQEWVSVQDMQKATEVIVHLLMAAAE